MTQKIDITKPLELDDGTPVTFVKLGDYPTAALIQLPEGATCHRDGSRGAGKWYYFLDTGLWCGGNATCFFTLRNVAETPRLQVGDKVAWRGDVTKTGVVILDDLNGGNDVGIRTRDTFPGTEYVATRHNTGAAREGGTESPYDFIKIEEKPTVEVRYSAMLTLSGMESSPGYSVDGLEGRTAALGQKTPFLRNALRNKDWAGVLLKTTYENGIPTAVELVTK
jgi:hypothetical protein